MKEESFSYKEPAACIELLHIENGISIKVLATEIVSSGQSSWNNLYGFTDMPVGNASYTYKVDTEKKH